MILKIQTVGLRPDTKHPRGATAAPPTGYTHTRFHIIVRTCQGHNASLAPTTTCNPDTTNTQRVTNMPPNSWGRAFWSPRVW